MNRENVKKAFAEYTNKYNAEDVKIKLKIDHTYRVADLCDRIARNLQLSEEDTDLAWLLGMLHDIGRFEQIRRFGTFKDADSIDHAHFGIQVLFEDEKIKDYVSQEYLLENGHEEIIKKAIWNHSAFRIEEGLSDRVKQFCHILRDADKIDILKVNHDVKMEDIYNVTTMELKSAPISEEVKQQYFAKQAVLRASKKTTPDHIVGHMSLVFELVYPESFQIVAEQGYLEKLFAFESYRPETKNDFEKMHRFMESFLAEKMGKGIS